MLTAAHCLPHLPPPHPESYTEERTYAENLGPIEGPPTIWAECVFVDPVSDIAVLVAPDAQELSGEWEAFEAFTETRTVLVVAVPQLPTAVSLMTRSGEWLSCNVRHEWPGQQRFLQIRGPADAYAPGTSGSPLVNEDGAAVGLVSCGPRGNPALAWCLPAWVWNGLRQQPSRANGTKVGQSGTLSPGSEGETV